MRRFLIIGLILVLAVLLFSPRWGPEGFTNQSSQMQSQTFKVQGYPDLSLVLSVNQSGSAGTVTLSDKKGKSHTWELGDAPSGNVLNGSSKCSTIQVTIINATLVSLKITSKANGLSYNPAEYTAEFQCTKCVSPIPPQPIPPQPVPIPPQPVPIPPQPVPIPPQPVPIQASQTTWLTNTSNAIYNSQSPYTTWNVVPGSLTKVRTNGSYVVGINESGNVYWCKMPCTGDFVYVNGLLTDFDIDSGAIWGYWSGAPTNVVSIPIGGSTALSAWQTSALPSGVIPSSIAVNSKAVYIINSNNSQLYYATKPVTSWQTVSGVTGIQVRANDNNIWLLSNNGSALTAPLASNGIPPTSGWTLASPSQGFSAPLTFSELAVKGSQYVWGVDPSGNIHNCPQPCSYGGWNQVGSGQGAKSISSTT